MIFEDDCAGLWVVEAGFSEFYLFRGTDVDMWNLAIGLNGNRKHVVSNSLDIDSHDSLILLDRLRCELNLNQLLRLLRDDSTLRRDFKLILKQLVLTEYLEIVGELNRRSVLEDDAFLVLEVVADLSEVYLWLGF